MLRGTICADTDGGIEKNKTIDSSNTGMRGFKAGSFNCIF